MREYSAEKKCAVERGDEFLMRGTSGGWVRRVTGGRRRDKRIDGQADRQTDGRTNGRTDERRTRLGRGRTCIVILSQSARM